MLNELDIEEQMTNATRWLGIIPSIGLLLLTGCGTLEVDVVSPTVSPATRPPVTQATSASTPLAPTQPPAPTPLTPRVLSFSAEVIETSQGEGISLTWEAAGEQATICPRVGDSNVGCRCLFDVSLTGSHVIEPADIVGAYTGFELTVDVGEERAVRHAPLRVECPDRFSDWFFDDPPGICPEDAPLSSYGAAQRFEHGMMIWVEASDTYYVFLNHDENVSEREQGWSTLTSLRIIEGPLALKPGAAPDNRVAETPPDGLFEPVSGFGLVWRGEVVGAESLRAALGWAVEPEVGFDTVYQCETSCGASWDCYLQGPEGEIFHLYWLLHFGHYWEVNR